MSRLGADLGGWVLTGALVGAACGLAEVGLLVIGPGPRASGSVEWLQAVTLLVGGDLVAGLALGLAAAVLAPLRRLLPRPPRAWRSVVGIALLFGAAGVATGAALAWEWVAHVDLAPLAVGLLGASLLGPARALVHAAIRRLPGALPSLAAGLALLTPVGIAAGPGESAIARRVTFDGSAVSSRTWEAVRWATDIDGDGHSSLLGGGDCAPANAAVHPGAREIPANGVDDNCFGGDALEAARGPESLTLTALPEGLTRPANLLLVTVDSVRADHTGFLGYGRDTTPRLDALAQGSMIVERFYCHTPATRWSIPMLHLSRWPSRIAWDKRTWPHTVKRSERTLAERLRAAGLRTGAVWPFPGSWGLNQGFESWVAPKARGEVWHRGRVITDKALSFLDDEDPRPWFLWVHYYDPHHPYRPPGGARSFGDRAIDRYDAEIHAADAQIGRLLDRLVADTAAWARTAVVVTADHGEEFHDHGGTAHKNRLYEELIRVPLLIRVPGWPVGRTPSAGGINDLLPTALDLIGTQPDSKDRFEGRSLVPDLLGTRVDPERPVFASLSFFATDGQKKRAAVVGSSKLIFDVRNGTRELYDLATDRRERDDLSRRRPEEANRMLELLMRFIERTGPYDHEQARAAGAKVGVDR